mgnify:CR=1 FL=1
MSILLSGKIKRKNSGNAPYCCLICFPGRYFWHDAGSFICPSHPYGNKNTCFSSGAGVSIATDISTAFSCGIVLFWLLHEDNEFHLYFRDLKIKPDQLFPMLKTGIPAAVQGAALCFANIFVQTATTFSSQNFSSGNKKRCKKILHLCLIFSIFFCVVLTLPLTFWRAKACSSYYFGNLHGKNFLDFYRFQAFSYPGNPVCRIPHFLGNYHSSCMGSVL